MSVVQDMVEWSEEFFLPFGELGLFAIAFIESSFFPIPPDIILIPLVLLNTTLALYYAAIATGASILGSFFGYYIGLKGGRRLIHKLLGNHNLEKAENYFRKYGILAVLAAAFSPIPYKIFTITAGALRMNIIEFTLASVIGRGGRFFLEAIILMVYGQQILEFLTNYFELATISVIIVAVGIYVFMKRK